MKEWLKQLLTKVLGNGFLVLLIVAVFYILYLRECKRTAPCPADDEKIVKKTDWQAMIDLANKPAITHIDTVYLKGKIIYVYIDKPIVPTVDPKDTTVSVYTDSLIKKDIDVSYTYKIRGELLSRKWSYRPVITEIRRTDTIYVPKPFETFVPVKTPQNGLYAYGIAGGNNSTFIFGGGLDFITKKDTEIGYLYQRFGNVNIHSIKLGGRFKIGKH